MVWYSPVDDMPDAMDVDSWRMARHSLGYVAELVAVGDWEGVARTVDKIASYQHVVVPEVLPSAARTWAERMFVDLSASSWLSWWLQRWRCLSVRAAGWHGRR